MSTNLFNPSDRRNYPARWRFFRGKQLFRIIDERSSDGTEELLAVSHITGITPRIQKNVTMFQSESLVGYKLCQVGDVAANTMWTWQGALGVSKYAGVISPSYNVYRQNGDIYNPRFLDLLLREKQMVDVYHSLSTGIRPSRLRLYPDVFLTIHFPVPPREEQEQIVRFLDWKMSAIDKLIATYKKEITCLEELSQAQIDTTISHLASNPSILKKLKRITACNRSTLDESTPYDYLFRYVDISSVDAKHGITHYEKTVFGKSPSRARRIVHKDDLIVSTVRTYLRAIAKIEDDDNVIVSTGFAVITPQNVDSGYLECLFKSNLFCDEVVRRSIGVSYPSINTSALMDISVPIPSFDTQIDIGKRLTAQRKKINRYIEYKKQQISNLNELKTRLISDAVTGKIDVRSIKLPNFAKEE